MVAERVTSTRWMVVRILRHRLANLLNNGHHELALVDPRLAQFQLRLVDQNPPGAGAQGDFHLQADGPLIAVAVRDIGKRVAKFGVVSVQSAGTNHVHARQTQIAGLVPQALPHLDSKLRIEIVRPLPQGDIDLFLDGNRGYRRKLRAIRRLQAHTPGPMLSGMFKMALS